MLIKQSSRGCLNLAPSNENIQYIGTTDPVRAQRERMSILDKYLVTKMIAFRLVLKSKGPKITEIRLNYVLLIVVTSVRNMVVILRVITICSINRNFVMKKSTVLWPLMKDQFTIDYKF